VYYGGGDGNADKNSGDELGWGHSLRGRDGDRANPVGMGTETTGTVGDKFVSQCSSSIHTGGICGYGY